MSHTPCDFPLGQVPLDSAQTIRKAWDNCALGHRVVDVNVDWNVTETTYDSCGRVVKIDYYYESAAESTKVTFTSDCCGDLCGTSFSLFTKDDAARYNILYSVCCGTTKPANINGIRYVLVNIQTDDPAEVVSLATKQAIDADTNASVDFTTAYAGKFLTITNVVNGDASDVVDIGTCFTFCILEQGAKTLVDSLNYVYNTDGQLIKVTTSSGKNVLDISGPFVQTTSISGDGKVARVSKNRELAVELSPLQNELLEKIYKQLKINNFYLSLMTDEEINEEDI